jgi:phosphopentomutase
MHALGPGKDSTAGHWELMGVEPGRLPTFPDGFPPAVIDTITEVSGCCVVCNRTSNGIEAIEQFGASTSPPGR